MKVSTVFALQIAAFHQGAIKVGEAYRLLGQDDVNQELSEPIVKAPLSI